MLSIEMLPAGNGDCLWIEYGPAGRPPRRVLIDGGTGPTYGALKRRLAALPAADRRFELLVVSHVDTDHINGALKLIRDRALGVSYGDVWFNGWRHLVGKDELGPVAGEQLTTELLEQGLPWNRAFGGGRVCVDPKAAALPTAELDGGLRLTVVSPTPAQLLALAPVWEATVRKAGLTPGGEPGAADQLGGPDDADDEDDGPEPADLLGGGLDVAALAAERFVEDTKEPNGSSIALVAEYEGRCVLLAADAFPSVLATSVETFAGGKRLRLDALKVSHHGSRKNTSPELLAWLDCPQFLISSNGVQHHHPNPQTVARILARPDADRTTVAFNYRTPETEVWDDAELKAAHGYDAVYPAADGVGCTILWE